MYNFTIRFAVWDNVDYEKEYDEYDHIIIIKVVDEQAKGLPFLQASRHSGVQKGYCLLERFHKHSH